MSLSTYSLPDLLRQWEYEKLTVEQMIGQLLQHLLALLQRLADLEQRLRHLEPPPRTAKP